MDLLGLGEGGDVWTYWVPFFSLHRVSPSFFFCARGLDRRKTAIFRCWGESEKQRPQAARRRAAPPEAGLSRGGAIETIFDFAVLPLPPPALRLALASGAPLGAPGLRPTFAPPALVLILAAVTDLNATHISRDSCAHEIESSAVSNTHNYYSRIVQTSAARSVRRTVEHGRSPR